MRPVSSIGGPTTTQVGKALAPKIVKDLAARGFKRSYYHHTVGKLMDLCSFAPELYNDYLEIFRAIYDDLKLKPQRLADGTLAPSVLLKLILPPSAKLTLMDTEVLKNPMSISLMRQNYVTSLSECDLRDLPEFYPTLAALAEKSPK